jgi:phosphoglycerate dehydrogenase-like enzyme
MQLTSAGADAYVKPGVLAKGTVLCNSTGAYNKTVSQHAFAVTLAMQKKLYLYRDNQNEKLWRDEGEVGSIADSTVLVMGLGEIGIAYAKMCKALGAYVIGVKRRPSACPEGIDEVYTMDALDEVLPRADIVFSILPGTGATYHIYTAERFKLMKKSAIFVNCGRGYAVDNKVLYDALNSGEIAAASIDVAEGEPLTADSPLWGLKNLFITPHVAGFFHIPDTLEIITDIACHNLKAFLSGGSYRNIVDFSTGYKA